MVHCTAGFRADRRGLARQRPADRRHCCAGPSTSLDGTPAVELVPELGRRARRPRLAPAPRRVPLHRHDARRHPARPRGLHGGGDGGVAQPRHRRPRRSRPSTSGTAWWWPTDAVCGCAARLRRRACCATPLALVATLATVRRRVWRLRLSASVVGSRGATAPMQTGGVLEPGRPSCPGGDAATTDEVAARISPPRRARPTRAGRRPVPGRRRAETRSPSTCGASGPPPRCRPRGGRG